MTPPSIPHTEVLRAILDALGRASSAHATRTACSERSLTDPVEIIDIDSASGHVTLSLRGTGVDPELERALTRCLSAISGVSKVDVLPSPHEEHIETMFESDLPLPATERRAFIIGPGEVGTRIGDALRRADWQITNVTRREGWHEAQDAADPAPRIVAVREEDLGDVLHRLGSGLRSKTMLLQNGFLEAVHGDLGPMSRGLIWFMSKGEVYHELSSSLFYGPVAGTIARGLRDGGLDVALVADGPPATEEMIFKGIWNCVVGLPLAIREVELSQFLTEHLDDARALVAECAEAASAEYGVTVATHEALDVIHATTKPIAWVRGGKKALPWRNGAIATFGRRHGIPTPETDALLRAAGADPA